MNRNMDHRRRARGCARNSANHYGGSFGYAIAPQPLIPDRPDLPVYETTQPSAPTNSVDGSAPTGGARRAQMRTATRRRASSTRQRTVKRGGTGGYSVDVSQLIRGMPVYSPITTVGGAAGPAGLDPMYAYNAPNASYTFEPSNERYPLDYSSTEGVPYMDVRATVGDSCVPAGGPGLASQLASSALPSSGQLTAQEAGTVFAPTLQNAGGGCPFLGGVNVSKYDETQPSYTVPAAPSGGALRARSRHNGRRRRVPTTARTPTTLKFKRGKFNMTRKRRHRAN